MQRVNLSPFPHSLSISSFSVHFLILYPFPHSLSFPLNFLIFSPFPHSLSISSQPGCKAATIRAALQLQQHKRLNRCNTICHSSLELKGEGLKHCAQINEIRADFIQNCIFSTQPYSYSSYVGCSVLQTLAEDLCSQRKILYKAGHSSGAGRCQKGGRGQ